MNPLTRPPTRVGILRNFFVPPDFKYSRRSLEVYGSCSTSSQATGAPEKNSSRSPGSSFHDKGFLMNGCVGSALAKFVRPGGGRLCSAFGRGTCPAPAQSREHPGCRSTPPPGRGQLARKRAEPP